MVCGLTTDALAITAVQTDGAQCTPAAAAFTGSFSVGWLCLFGVMRAASSASALVPTAVFVRTLG